MRRILQLLFLFALVTTNLYAKDYTVVIDAGHGGKDPGALSANKKIREKDITLNVALMVGDHIKQRHPEVKVIYTRKTDKFVQLNERARIANKASADLFISIHVNAAKNRSAKGAETYTLGIESDRTERNLDIAKRENSVILLEDNHEKEYNFNPNSPESYIIFEFMQSEYVKESIHIAQYVQENFTADANRHDRGVRQAGFLVLHATSMPSILVELGYISNNEEAKFLASASGQKKLSQCISNAFDRYYADQQRLILAGNEEEVGTVDTEQGTVSSSNEERPVFKIQFLSSSTEIKEKKQFKGLNPIDYYLDKGVYKYTYGETTDYNEALRLKKTVNEKFKDAFIVAFIHNKRIDTKHAIALYQQNNPTP